MNLGVWALVFCDQLKFATTGLPLVSTQFGLAVA